jgi:hypothetical protein
MDIRVITKYPSTPKIRVKPLSLAHMEHMHIDVCLSGYVMLPHLFNDA